MDDNLVWLTLASAAVLEPHGKALVKHGVLDIAVFKQGEQLYALSDSCPHSGASLCVGRVEGGHVKCPAHGLRFRLTDGLLAGSALGTESTTLGVRTFPVRIAGDELQISIQPMDKETQNDQASETPLESPV